MAAHVPISVWSQRQWLLSPPSAKTKQTSVLSPADSGWGSTPLSLAKSRLFDFSLLPHSGLFSAKGNKLLFSQDLDG